MKSISRRLFDWQNWPFYFFYFPISYAWVVYYLRTRSLWFYTASNPTLAFGGFEGEGKREMYRQLPAEFCPRSTYVQPGTPFGEVVQRVEEAGLRYPFIVKPNVGMKGLLFRKIETEEQLRTYHRHMPAEYIVQEFLDLPYEVSVFYCRMPDEPKGRITALIQKNLMQVTGDGHSTLDELVQRDPLAARWRDRIRLEQGSRMNRVPAAGEVCCLSHIGNIMNGAQFINLKDQIDERLEHLFDEISRNNQFYYGRYDIKCAS
ncbi:MAG TPA: hypothetical protein VHK69_03255, partial [Chitinophagaceae bacterium]|nr:hypothetical protein [Chitinophagaceae bacterium]